MVPHIDRISIIERRCRDDCPGCTWPANPPQFPLERRKVRWPEMGQHRHHCHEIEFLAMVARFSTVNGGRIENVPVPHLPIQNSSSMNHRHRPIKGSDLLHTFPALKHRPGSTPEVQEAVGFSLIYQLRQPFSLRLQVLLVSRNENRLVVVFTTASVPIDIGIEIRQSRYTSSRDVNPSRNE